jgi:hypothetical protein
MSIQNYSVQTVSQSISETPTGILALVFCIYGSKSSRGIIANVRTT